VNTYLVASQEMKKWIDNAHMNKTIRQMKK
jgi:hypothetical protein